MKLADCTTAEIGVAHLQATHDVTRCENNLRCFSLRKSIALEAGNTDAARDNEGLCLYWSRQLDHAQCALRNLAHELAYREAQTV